MKEIFGIRVFDDIAAKITDEDFGGKMDIRTSIIIRPDLFERALIGILGEAGERILEYIWDSRLCNQFELDSSMTYHNIGDLAICIQAIRRATAQSPP
jgi:hypothetical protein